MDVPQQDVISRDNVSVKVSAVIYFRVMDPEKSIIQVENRVEATSQLAQTTLRSVLGQHELDDMLAEREKLNADVQSILDQATETWGIKVTNVEIKHVDLDESHDPGDRGTGGSRASQTRPRSFMPKASFRLHSACRKPPGSWPLNPRPCSCVTCKRSRKSPAKGTPRRSCSRCRSISSSRFSSRSRRKNKKAIKPRDDCTDALT